jgi:hypothetical protein
MIVKIFRSSDLWKDIGNVGIWTYLRLYGLMSLPNCLLIEVGAPLLQGGIFFFSSCFE